VRGPPGWARRWRRDDVEPERDLPGFAADYSWHPGMPPAPDRVGRLAGSDLRRSPAAWAAVIMTAGAAPCMDRAYGLGRNPDPGHANMLMADSGERHRQPGAGRARRLLPARPRRPGRLRADGGSRRHSAGPHHQRRSGVLGGRRKQSGTPGGAARSGAPAWTSPWNLSASATAPRGLPCARRASRPGWRLDRCREGVAAYRDGLAGRGSARRAAPGGGRPGRRGGPGTVSGNR